MAIVVDAYGPGQNYARYFKENDVICIHIQSSLEQLPRLSKINYSLFDYSICVDNDIDDAIAEIKALIKERNCKLICIIPGVEPGVFLADQLSEYFGLKANDISKSKNRRNKFFMLESIKSYGLATPKTIKSSHLDEIIETARMWSSWPLVLKPLDSAGTDGVYYCHNYDDLSTAFNSVIGKTNNMGLINSEIILQEFLNGIEYMVNTVSSNGKHIVTDILLAEKKIISGYSTIYDKNILISPDSDDYSILKNYVFNVLKALSIDHGAAHTEVMLTNKGPIIIECGARISGVCHPESYDLAIGYNQVQVAVDSYVNTDKFNKYPEDYKKKSSLMQVLLSSEHEGKIIELNFSNYLKNLKSSHFCFLKPNVGDVIVKTFDLSSTLGICHMVSNRDEELNTDYSYIKMLLKETIKVSN